MKKMVGGVGKARLTAHDVKQLRQAKKENQTDFWQRFGVTQSRGSRFEKGAEIPTSVLMLIELYLQKKVSDKDLQRAMQKIA